MVKCTCGTYNESKYKFCKKCGKKLEGSKATKQVGIVGKENSSGKTKQCPHCKKVNYPQAVYCQYCGKEIKQVVPKREVIIKPPVFVSSDAPLLEFQKFSTLEQKLLAQAKVKFLESQVRYECPKETLWNDKQIAALYEAYCHNHSALVLFLKQAESLSVELAERRNACRQQLLQSPDSNAELRDQRLALFSSIAEKDTDTFFQTTKAVVEEFIKKVPVFATGCQLSTPLNLCGQHSSPKLLQQHIFVGTSIRYFHICNQSLALPRLEYIRLINEKNLIVKYDESSKEQCMSFVSTLLGRMILTTSGVGLRVDVVDTKDWMGVSDQFNDSELCGLITQNKEVEPLLSRLYKDEMEVITTTLKKAHFNSVAEYNASNINKLCTQVLVIKDLNDCASKTNVSLLPDLMGKAAQAGLCVILLVNEDTPKEEGNRYRTTSIDPMASVERYALTINLTNNTLQGNPYEALLFDVMDEKQLAAAIAQESTAFDEPQGASSLDYLPKNSKDFWKWNGTDEISLTIGMENYLPNVLRLTDNPVESLIMVTGSISSAINPWLDTLVLSVLTKYDPSTAQLLLVDCYGKDSTLFNKFAPISSMEDTPISIVKVEGFDDGIRKRLFSHKEGTPRLFVVIVGSYETQLKHYIDKCRPLYSKGKLRGVDIICVDARRDAWEPNKIEGWQGLQIAFGPSVMYSDLTRRDQFSLGEDEFYYNGVKNIALLTDEVSANKIVEMLREKLCERFPQSAMATKKTSVFEKVQKTCTYCRESLYEDALFCPNCGKKVEDEFIIVDPPQPEPEEEPTVVKPKQQAPTITTPVEPLPNVNGSEEVNYKTTFPLPKTEELWTGNAEKALTIPIGVHINSNGIPKTKNICFNDSKPNSNAAFVLGGTGCGKTSFINALIVNAAYRYSPDELNMYLVDFSGVEFIHYEKYGLPHAKLIATGADREFGLSVLKEVEQEMNDRINHPEYTDYPRILLVLDECQRFFLEETSRSSISAQATAIIDNILRQGRKFRINIIMATQKLSGIPSTLHEMVDFRIVGKPTRNDFNKWMTGREIDFNAISLYDGGEFIFMEKGVCDDDLEEQHIKSFFVGSGKLDKKHELDEKVEMLHEYAQQHPELCKTVPETRSFRGTEIVTFTTDRMLDIHKERKAQPTSMYFYLGESVEGKEDIAIQIKAGQEFQHILIAGGTSPVDGESVVVNGMMSLSQSYELEEVDVDEIEEKLEEVDFDGLNEKFEESEDNQVEEEQEETEEILADQTDNILFEPQAVNYVFNFDSNDSELAARINKMLVSPFSSKSKVIENTEEAVRETLEEVCSLIEKRENDQNRYPHIFLTFLQFGYGRMFNDTPLGGDSKCTKLIKEVMKRGSQCGFFVILQSQGLKDLALLKKPDNRDFNHIVTLQMSSEKALKYLNLPEAGDLNLKGADTSGKCRGLYNDVNNEIVEKFKPYKFINENN